MVCDELLNELPQEDKDKFFQYVSMYSEGPSPDVSADVLLTPWAEAKRDLYHMFNNNFILRKNVEVKASFEKIKENIRESLLKHPFLCALSDELCSDKVCDRISDFVNHYWDLRSTLSPYTLAKTTTETSFEFDDGRKFPRGTKVNKIFKYLAERFNIDKELYEDFCVEYSRYFNTAKLTGELCLSIHPLDYITASDNSCDWHSCMRWMTGAGEYRLGTIEMMTSPIVVIAYLRAADDMRISRNPEYYWNSKKWRTFIIVTPEIITTIKNYPYEHEELSAIAVEWLRELAEASGYSKYQDELFKDLPSNLDFETYEMYNDFHNDPHIYAYLSKSYDLEAEKQYINYSGVTVCMCCGRTCAEYDDQSRVCCSDCQPAGYCTNCDCTITDSNELYEGPDGELLCYECYHELVIEDDITGGNIFKDDPNLRIVHFMYNEDQVGPEYTTAYFDYWFSRVGKQVFTEEEYQSVYDQVVENEDGHIYIDIAGILPNQGFLVLELGCQHYAYFSIHDSGYTFLHEPNWYNLLIENLNQRAVS